MFFYDYSSKVNETEKGIELEIEIPGIKKEEVELFIDNNYLHLKAKNERRDYEKYYKLSSSLDTNNFTANLEDGILKVVLPKKEKLKRKLIAIS